MPRLVWTIPETIDADGPHLFAPLFVKWVFSVPPEDIRGFHAWLRENEAALASELAALDCGVGYKGTYGIATTQDAGYLKIPRYRTYWTFESRKAMDAWDPTSSDLPESLRVRLRYLANLWLVDSYQLSETYIPAVAGQAYKVGGTYRHFADDLP
ncbi:hypothetical protein [Sulfitobacter sp. W074]|uniref:hypothetical protein n=1 Tax=Sulfitobacter sp. W074 TaxID=2867026 RepID=UPI0021A5471F|nr:hypothetical protein [Sulfitobacter sp. W074]UWR38411.1 hypothetical protein K3762_05095 [Sulfitobacter sp. W074]